MSKPHVCPVCNGNGKKINDGSGTAIIYETCPACLGACVLWEPPHIAERAQPQPFIPFEPYKGTGHSEFVPMGPYVPNTYTGNAIWEWREKDAAKYQFQQDSQKFSYDHFFISFV